jgi:hypothetical protein
VPIWESRYNECMDADGRRWRDVPVICILLEKEREDVNGAEEDERL